MIVNKTYAVGQECLQPMPATSQIQAVMNELDSAINMLEESIEPLTVKLRPILRVIKGAEDNKEQSAAGPELVPLAERLDRMRIRIENVHLFVQRLTDLIEV